jgi:hypothetical protein
MPPDSRKDSSRSGHDRFGRDISSNLSEADITACCWRQHQPPVGRMVLLSKLEETLVVAGPKQVEDAVRALQALKRS